MVKFLCSGRSGGHGAVMAGLGALLAWLPPALVAQEFTLFEDVEQPGNRSEPALRATRVTPGQAGQPDFRLIGTAKIGDRKSALLAHRDGSTLSVTLDESAVTPVPGHTQYQLIEVGSGEVALRYPENAPCVPFPDQGVQCRANNIASLDLKLGEALVQQENPVAGDDQAQVEEDVAENPDNPFARIRAQVEAGNNPRANGQRFQPRRIPQEEVPPGFRVVSTPFGDRLVEE